MAHKLLLADDSVTIQRVIELTFAEEDMLVAVVGNGRDAIDRIQADRPDIVLADIGMPEKDGYEVAAFIKQNPRLAHIPVVLLTGAFEPIDDTRAQAVGCDAVLIKPFEPQMVITRVKELLAARPSPLSTESSDPMTAGEHPNETTPQPDAGPRRPQGGVEDYFDRLDAAFARLASTPRAPALDSAKLASTVDELRVSTPVDGAPRNERGIADWDPELTSSPTPARQPQLAQAFAALLAAEQGQPLPTSTVDPFMIAEETIEEIVRRVVARLADDSMRALVIETAERLVRDEIERIKKS